MNFIYSFCLALLGFVVTSAGSSSRSYNRIFSIWNKKILSGYENVLPQLLANDRALSDQCRNDFSFYLSNLLNQDTPSSWALQMFDSSTKFPEGILTGGTTDLGIFDECLDVQSVATNIDSFNGQHCLATISFDPEDSSRNEYVATTSKRNGTINTFTGGVTGIGVVDLNSITVAVCVPSSCSDDDTSALMQQLVIAFEDLYGLQLGEISTQVNPLQCHKKTTVSLRPVDWVAIAIFGFFIVLVILSTIYDMTKEKESKKELFTAFSAYTNWQRLMNTKLPPGSLPSLNGLRFISMGWVALCHRYTHGTAIPSDNELVFVNGAFKDWKYIHISNGTLSVDSFFMLGGLLAAFIFLKEMDKVKKFNLPLFYIHRYVRLTPAFAMVILFHASLLIYMASGPLWETQVTPMMENCQADWWANILYIKNYYNPLPECVGQSWYLQVDMQLHWVSPIILYPLWRWPKIGKCLLAAFFVIGAAIDFGVAYGYNIRVSMPERRQNINWDNDFRTRMYYTTHTRYNTWLVGIITGYILYNIKKTKKAFTMPNYFVILMAVCATVLTMGSVFSMYPFNQPDYVYSPLNAALFHTFTRVAWAIGVALIVFLCCNDYGGPVNAILSWKLFVPLARVSYSMFLVHTTIQTILIYNTRTVTHLDDASLVAGFISDMVFAVAVAIIWVIAFESPFIIIEKSLTGRGKPVKQTNTPLVEEKSLKIEEEKPSEGPTSESAEVLEPETSKMKETV